MAIGSLYNSRGVVVGQAAGFVGPEGTPLPADTLTVFDESVWTPTTVALGAASAGSFDLTLSGGPLSSPVVVSANAFNITAAALKAAIEAALTAAGKTGYTATVTLASTTYTVSLSGTAAAQIVISGDGTGLTGATFVVTPPLWVPGGATEQGWSVNYNPSVQDINIEEQPTPADQQVTTATLQFVANLAEDTVQSLQWALSAAKTVQAPDATHFGKTTLRLQPSLPVYAVALEAKNKFGYPRRYYVPRATCATNVGQTFRRAAGARLVPVTFTSICDFSDIQVVEITANHS